MRGRNYTTSRCQEVEVEVEVDHECKCEEHPLEVDVLNVEFKGVTHYIRAEVYEDRTVQIPLSDFKMIQEILSAKG